MFRIISDKKMKDREKLVEVLQKRDEKQKMEIAELKVTIRELRNELEIYQVTDTLVNENKNLTEWINKIIDKTGIYELSSDMTSFRVPIYRRQVPYFDEYDDIHEVKETVVPSIIIREYGKEKDDGRGK